MKLETLQDIYSEYTEDPRLEHLRGPGINFVPGVGPIEPELMLIGEAPGKMENAQGLPFIGAAGATLSQLLQEEGINLGAVFRTNVVKYWPHSKEVNNAGSQYNATRPPSVEEIEISREYLMREIEVVNPHIVGVCGRSAAMALIPDHAQIGRYNGDLIEDVYVPLFHPALMSHAPHRRAEIRNGYAKLASYLRKIDVAG